MTTRPTLDLRGVQIARSTSNYANDDGTNAQFILDSDWAKNAFLVDASSLETIDKENRIFSSAHFKFTNTSLGSALCINPKPQYTRYSDIRDPGRLPDRKDVHVNAVYDNVSYGMGRYYSEAIDDNNQIIYMRFGVPSFNSLTQFFTGFYNTGQARLAKTGRYDTDFFAKAGYIAGIVAQVVFWPLAVIHVVGVSINWLFGHNSSKFYVLKPSMLVYWGAVNSIVNRIAVNKGIFPVTNNIDPDKIGSSYNIDATEMQQMHDMMPDVFSPSGYYDIYQVANKAQRIKNQLDLYLYKTFERDDVAHNFKGQRQRVGQDIVNSADGNPRTANTVNAFFTAPAYNLADYSNMSNSGMDPSNSAGAFAEANGKGRTFDNAVTGWLSSSEGGPLQATAPSNDTSKATSPDGAGTLNGPQAQGGAAAKPDLQMPDAERSFRSIKDKPQTTKDGFVDNLISEFQDGSQFAAFRVDYTGSVSESFSNSVGESDIASKMNSASSSGRDANFNFGGVLEDVKNMPVVGQVIEAAKSVATGVLDSFAMSGLVAFAGGSFVDIPKHWQSSSASLPRASYTIKLTSPYGNPISQINNIYIPLAMLMAGALPLSTGKQSYTSPFLCELYDKGRCQTRLGMIDSLSVTRGTSNLGFDKKGKALALDVTFSIVDMSSIMHMQLTGDSVFGTDNGMFDEETVFSDYLAVLAGLNVSDQMYMLPKLKRQMANKVNNLKSLTSPGMWAMKIHQDTPIGLLDVFYKGRGALNK